MLSLGDIVIEGSKIIAPRIGMCSNNITIAYNYYNSSIDANFQGCPSDQGFGNLPRKSSCSGAGGAHGGYGGSGAS